MTGRPPCPSLDVRDLDASRAFYQTAFTASVTWETHIAQVCLPGGATLRLNWRGPAPGAPFDAAAWHHPPPVEPQHLWLPLTVRSLSVWGRTLFLSGVTVERWCSGDNAAATVCVRDLDDHILEFSVQQAGAIGNDPAIARASH